MIPSKPSLQASYAKCREVQACDTAGGPPDLYLFMLLLPENHA
jgi:hypothetical protein